jgi:hypothetical protein
LGPDRQGRGGTQKVHTTKKKNTFYASAHGGFLANLPWIN